MIRLPTIKGIFIIKNLIKASCFTEFSYSSSKICYLSGMDLKIIYCPLTNIVLILEIILL